MIPDFNVVDPSAPIDENEELCGNILLNLLFLGLGSFVNLKVKMKTNKQTDKQTERLRPAEGSLKGYGIN